MYKKIIKNIIQVLMTMILMLSVNTAFAQFDKASCSEILKGYDKSNQYFTQLHIASLDFEKIKLKFDISWLKDFKINFMDQVLNIEYTSDKGVFQTYIPYTEIVKINTSKTAVDILIRE
jgi:hypothetical protein